MGACQREREIAVRSTYGLVTDLIAHQREWEITLWFRIWQKHELELVQNYRRLFACVSNSLLGELRHVVLCTSSELRRSMQACGLQAPQHGYRRVRHPLFCAGGLLF